MIPFITNAVTRTASSLRRLQVAGHLQVKVTVEMVFVLRRGAELMEAASGTSAGFMTIIAAGSVVIIKVLATR